MEKRFGKRDLVLLLAVAAVVLAIWCVYHFRNQTQGNLVEITVDGETYGIYSLDEDQEIPIEIDGDVCNILAIRNQEADMTDADCPDQLCVDMNAISAEGETIVCLPHKIVVEVISSDEESDFDTIAN